MTNLACYYGTVNALPYENHVPLGKYRRHVPIGISHDGSTKINETMALVPTSYILSVNNYMVIAVMVTIPLGI